MKLGITGARRRSQPSIIPLIDVLLVLLFFFMLVCASVQYGRTRVEFAPQPQQAQGPVAADVLVMANGFLRIQGSDYNVPSAIPVLRDINARGEVRLLPSKGLPLQTLLQLWERLRAEGIRARLAEDLVP